MEFPCKPTDHPLVETWFESGLDDSARLFKVLRNRTYDRQDLPLEEWRLEVCHKGLPSVLHLHTAVLTSEACGKSTTQER